MELVNELAKTPLEFEPGTGWRYSLCHDVLAALVEVLSGEKFENYVKAHIFDPLGMENSDFLHPMDDWDGFARMYQYDGKTGEFSQIFRYWCHIGKEFAGGGGGCTSTVEDYIKFLEALRMGDVILNKETIDMMATNYLTEQQQAMYVFGGTDIGYGLGMRAPREGSVYREFGWGGAAGAFASVDRELNMTFYYSQHVMNSPNRHLRLWIHRALRADLLGEKISIPIKQVDDKPELTY